MFSKQWVNQSGLVVFLVTVFAAAPALFAAQAAADSADVSKLLADAKGQSAQLSRDAAKIKGYTLSTANAQTHAVRMELINEHVNNVGHLAFELNNARAAASPLQRETIDRINPLLEELASSVNSTVTHLNRVSGVLQMPPYNSYLEAKAKLASELAKLISDSVDYGDAKTRSQELEREMELINYD